MLLRVPNRVSGQDSPKKRESAIEYPVPARADPRKGTRLAFRGRLFAENVSPSIVTWNSNQIYHTEKQQFHVECRLRFSQFQLSVYPLAAHPCPSVLRR